VPLFPASLASTSLLAMSIMSLGELGWIAGTSRREGPNEGHETPTSGATSH
jgi:hypothetical protein